MKSLKQVFSPQQVKATVNDISTNLKKALQHLKNHNLDIAEFYLREALKIDPKNFWALQDLANIAYERHQYAKAAEAYRLAYANAGTNLELRAYSSCGLAKALTSLGDYLSAEKIYKDCIAESPNYVYAHTGLAIVYEKFEPRAFEKIIPLYQKALQLEPNLQWINQNLQKNLAQELEYAKNPSAKIATQNNLEHKQGEISPVSLAATGNWKEVFERACLTQTTHKTSLQKAIAEDLKNLPPKTYDNLESFYSATARRLVLESNANVISSYLTDLNLATHLYEAAVEIALIPNACNVSELLNVFITMEAYERAESLLPEVLVQFPGDPEISLAAARLLAKLDNFAAACFLYGEYVKSSSEIIESETLQEIIDVHHQATIAGSSKLTQFIDVLASLLKDEVQAKWQKATQLASAVVIPDAVRQIDDWMGEFYQLLGDYPLELIFDMAHYQGQNSHYFGSEGKALYDYFRRGWQQRLSFDPAIDNDYLRQQLTHHKIASNEPLLLLFLRHERILRLAPNRLVDPDLLHTGSENVKGSVWLNHVGGRSRDLTPISRYFDTELFYERSKCRESALTFSPIMNFLRIYPLADCNRLFHTGFYTKRYGHLLNGKVPILHYLTDGAFTGCLPNPYCDFNQMSGQQRIDYLKLS